eukprot:TRINITY_DN48302_c0_g1_i1.p1 TRINITY_DN48302_c0_g1~~TRINITY_DN48302_c0_g1_i1.p1  ORF type:complete len:546 (-),score=99.31 TRINITY_DN48302_c0_g1_i1:62-1699(-)
MAVGAAPTRCDPRALPAACLEEPRVSELLELSCGLCPELGDPLVKADGSLHRCLTDEADAEVCRARASVLEGTPSRELPAREMSGPCLDTTQDQGALADLAFSLTTTPSLAQRCPVGFWAAYLVTLQYAVTTRLLDIPSGLNATADASPFSRLGGFDLSPFPFWSTARSLGEQIDFHSNFMAAHLLLCDDVHKTGPFRGRYVLRAAHDKPEYHCAVRSSEHQLIRRCRERKRQQHFQGMRGFAVAAPAFRAAVGVPPQLADAGTGLRCPSQEEQLAFARRREQAVAGGPGDGASQAWARRADYAVAKYTERAAGSAGGGGRPGRGCEEPASEWRFDLRIHHKCVLMTVLERLQPAPGARVLDWGTGCGHKLTWAAQLYDIEGVGIDIVGESIEWARRHAIGTYCQLDGRYVEWLPDDHFDFVLSYAALTHLHPDDQCQVVTELVGKVRVGGRLWFGWNTPNILNFDKLIDRAEIKREEFWNECFGNATRVQERWKSGIVAAAWETLTEAYMFPDDFQNHDTYLFWPPAYSLFVTRLPTNLQEPFF